VTLLLVAAGLVFTWLAKQILGALVAQQVRGSIPDYAAQRTRSAAQKLPADLKDEYEAEWLAELAALDSKPITAIRYAHGLSRAAREIARRAGVESPQGRIAMAVARGSDLASSATLLLLFLPLLLTFALATFIGHGRQPIFAKSIRLGKGGKPFHRLRFATLKRLPDGQLEFTPLGRFLRRFSLDELPILLNILRGDLSLVGPPAVPASIGEDGHAVLEVRPGIFSWQVLAEHGLVSLSLEEARRRDEHRTLGRDLALILRSMKALARADI
jgi:exopolysaccharide production protein ExoY